MPPMPYAMEIGPMFSLLDDYVEDQVHMVRLLAELRDPSVELLSQTEMFSAVSVKTLPNDPVAHIESDWFGYPPVPAGQPPSTSQPAFNASNPQPTGWWTRWYGDAAGITRETLVRALEVALGVPHNPDDLSPQATRCWRLQFIWTCGAPFFQGWVSWMSEEDEPQEGYVTVTFTTPGNGHPLYATPRRPAGAFGPPSPPDYEDPAWTVGPYGMWIIGENRTEVLRAHHKHFKSLGDGVLPNWPNAFVRTYGGVTVIAPAEVDGGMLDAGRTWS
jgi:hypothetical protein